ncbi:hypothetical protein MYCTH_2123570 [Thermothelomyces thermophilus ATCC 42464]|uniref:ZZ-type domain-containing protein n=1 Tax=Thermothelomyces thermophilus (strain ATCC 42464 / BCRC 31852 / DSM 1799) TaxID=573729 RepID=G2Q5Z0_THET4|nr:uncharacterized protein MYCTH_2123570 [Thermothelomyces thermophilus ATCC 42464]AEO54667.1 hypothetical protein MYCTH_2123570 [Thermothelomyces thermophilus ATCC 42464]
MKRKNKTTATTKGRLQVRPILPTSGSIWNGLDKKEVSTRKSGPWPAALPSPEGNEADENGASHFRTSNTSGKKQRDVVTGYSSGSRRRPAFFVGCEAKAIVHGTLSRVSGTRSTLLVYGFCFLSYPRSWEGCRVGGGGIIGQAGGKFAKTIEQTETYAAEVTGNRPPDEWGNHFEASWSLKENSSQPSGIRFLLDHAAVVRLLIESGADARVECGLYDGDRDAIESLSPLTLARRSSSAYEVVSALEVLLQDLRLDKDDAGKPKCTSCPDFDVCSKCYPTIKKYHHGGISDEDSPYEFRRAPRDANGEGKRYFEWRCFKGETWA